MIELEFFRQKVDVTTIEPELLYAFAQVESSLDPHTARFEPGWKYWYKTKEYAKSLGITEDTEKVFQATSWGLMQVMGTVAREHAFDGHLTELIDPYLNISVAISKLEQLFKRWNDVEAVISSYNQGYPRKHTDGTFVNQAYVDKVMGKYRLLV